MSTRAERRPSLIPAVVVSGFLGSGKTTLVRALLADAQRNGVRAAVEEILGLIDRGAEHVPV